MGRTTPWGSPRGRRRVAALALVTLVTVAGVGCAGDSAAERPDPDRVAQRLADEVGLTREQARCATDRVRDAVDADALRQVADAGLSSVPQAGQRPFVQALVACTLGAE